jgi:Ca2+-binding EF-hand superfamily protein
VSLGVSLSPDQVMAIREDLDSNGDGTISKSEFEVAVKSKSKKGTPPKRMSSSSGSGTVDKAWGAIMAVVQRNPDKWESAVESLFLKLDSNSTGEVDLTELGKGLKGLGVQLTDQQRAALMQDFDSDFNGRISLKEVILYFLVYFWKCVCVFEIFLYMHTYLILFDYSNLTVEVCG